MKRIDRYMVKELTVPLLIGTFVIALLFVANELIFLFKTFNTANVPWLAIGQTLLYGLPEWLSLTLPVGTAMGTALAVSRLARESEVTAMRAVGIRVGRILLPFAAAGVVMAVVNFLVVDYLLPETASRKKEVLRQVALAGTAPVFQSNVMINLDRYSANFGSVQRTEDGGIRVEEVLLVERPRPGYVGLVVAPYGTYRDGVWTLPEAAFYELEADRLVAIAGETVTINEQTPIDDLFMPPSPTEENSRVLREAIQRSRALGQNPVQLEVAYHVKFSLPASCFVFSITSGLLALLLARTGPFMGVLVSLGLVILYYNAYVISTDIIGRNGWLSPMASAWLPNLICLVVSLWLWRRAA